MKHLLFITAILLLTLKAQAQNVGIGTTSPLTKLHVFGGASGNPTPQGPLVVEGNSNTYINVLSPNANETAVLFGNASNAASGGIVYNSSATLNGLQFRTNGNSTKMVIDNAGNVGIGTNTPFSPLTFNNTAGEKISFYGTAGNNYGFGIQSGLLQIHTDGAASDIAFGYGSSSLFFEKMRIKGNGNVGIGTETPYSSLTFNGNSGEKISFNDNGTTNNNYGIGIQPGLLQIHTNVAGSDIAFGHGSSYTLTERMRIINNAGYDGMILNGRLLLKNGSADLVGGGGGVWLYKADNSALLGFMGAQNNQNIGFYGGPAGWGFVYDAINSRVGIGTTPAYPLDVTGDLVTIGSFVNTATFTNRTGVYASCNNTPFYGYGVRGYGGWRGVLGEASLPGSGDRVGVIGLAQFGTGTAIGVQGVATGGIINWAGYFSGDVYAIGTYQGSDRKLKNDIRPLSGALSIIEQLKPSVYTFKTDEYKQMHLPEGLQYGLIADEVQQVVPGAIKRTVQPAEYENHDEHTGKKLSDEVEFNALNYTEMIPILIGAVKEQQIIINSQQKQIDELKKLVEKLLKITSTK